MTELTKDHFIVRAASGLNRSRRSGLFRFLRSGFLAGLLALVWSSALFGQTAPTRRGALPAAGKSAATRPARTGSTAVVDTTNLTRTEKDSLARRDSLQASSDFRTTVKYSSRDSSRFENSTQTMELFGDANVTYGTINLKAEYIKLNYTTNEVYAKGRYDSTAKKTIGEPIFQDGSEKYNTREIRYNFKTKKGLIQGVITQQGEGNIRGKVVKKDAEDNLYIRGSIYTTCNLATPHFHINAPRLKVIHNKQVVAGPFNMVVNQIPLPIGLPFGFFPFPKKKDIGVSGILIPQYGQEPNGRGYYLRDGGYYWAVSENLGLQFKGQIYSRGSWGLGVSSAYNKRYSYSGSVDIRFARNRSGDRVDSLIAPSNDFSITWAHAPIPHGRGSFSANVNVSSNSYNQINAYQTSQVISNVAGSSVQYNRTFGAYVRAGTNLRVNQQFGQVNRITNRRSNGKTDISSDFTLGVNQIAPFALKGGSGRWYESFRVGLDISASALVSNTVVRNIDTTGLGFRISLPGTSTTITQRPREQVIRDSINRADSISRGLYNRDGTVSTDANLIAFTLANLNTIWRNRTVQGRYSLPISLPNIKLFRYLNITPGFSIQGDMYTKKLTYTPVNNNQAVRVDTARGIFFSYNFAINASVNTRAYGTYYIRSRRIEAIRHTIAPSVSFSYVPDFSNPAFGIYQRLEAVGSLASLPEYRRTLSRYRGLGGTYGSSTSGASANISFGIVNQLEMKVRTLDDSTGQAFRKVPLLDNLSLTGSYNLLAQDGYNLSPIQVSANTQVFKMINFNFSSTFDPYAYRPYTTSYYNPYATTEGYYSPIPTDILVAYASPTGTSYQKYARYALFAGQGLARLTNLQAYISTRLAPKGANKPKQSTGVSDATMKTINQNPDMYVDFNIPWSLNFSYTFSYAKLTPVESRVVQAATLTGDFSLTPKWKFTFNTGYDFTYKAPSLTTIGINRDLHCWEMAFNWTPYAGSNQRTGTYSFDLRARSAILQELKLSRRRSFSSFSY